MQAQNQTANQAGKVAEAIKIQEAQPSLIVNPASTIFSMKMTALNSIRQRAHEPADECGKAR